METAFFYYYTEYICLQENVSLTLLPKNAHGITQRPTLLTAFNMNSSFIEMSNCMKQVSLSYVLLLTHGCCNPYLFHFTYCESQAKFQFC